MLMVVCLLWSRLRTCLVSWMGGTEQGERLNKFKRLRWDPLLDRLHTRGKFNPHRRSFHHVAFATIPALVDKVG